MQICNLFFFGFFQPKPLELEKNQITILYAYLLHHDLTFTDLGKWLGLGIL